MVVQHYSDWGTSFNTDDLKGQTCWEAFVDHLKQGGEGTVFRVRWLGDRIPGGRYIFDLRYCYVAMDGEVYTCQLPEHHCEGSRDEPKKLMYKWCQEAGIFVPGAFDAMSIFIQGARRC